MKSIISLERLKRCNVFLYFSTIIANLASFSVGCVYVWSSPAIPRLNGQIDFEHNPLKENITPFEESWIASLVPLGAAISAFISGYLSDKIGRKRTLLASGLPMMVGFGILVFSTEVAHIYLGRFLCGLGVGTAFTIIPIYIGEIAQSTNRGTLGCFLTFFISSGNMYIYILAPYVSLKLLSAGCLVVPIIFLILFGCFIPESSYYYISKNNLDLARESLRKFRFNSEELVNRELPIIIEDVQESFRRKIGLKELIQDDVLKTAFGISIGLMAFQQLSGINAVFFYMQSIFEEAGSSISSDTCVLIAGIIQILASIITLPTVDKFGRRFLLLTSAIGNTLSNFIGGIYFILKERTSVDVTDLQSIFEEAGSSISSDTCVLIAGIIQILASIITLPTVDKFGRRFLLLTSAIGNTLSNFIGGIYFILKERTSVDVTDLSWLPIITINLFIMTYTLGFGPVSFTMIGELFPFIMTYTLGFGPVSFTMIGELFPPHVKSLAATLNIFVCLLSVFIVTNVFPFMRDQIIGGNFKYIRVLVVGVHRDECVPFYEGIDRIRFEFQSASDCLLSKWGVRLF
ncbi:Sugar transporter [Popillia japonica]|uniref:Sugar transporter n=1 Tax=Popillia japonica TaxID=7064 RepID=A0AAW1JJL1_POPJA